VFGAPGRELSYDEIFQGVMARRMVAKASIDDELLKRPCFVLAGDNRWRFEPGKGSELAQTSEARARRQRESSGPIPLVPEPQPPSPGELPPPVPTPYHNLLKELRQEWEALGDLLKPDRHDLHQQLQNLAESLAAMAQRLQSDLAALAQTDIPEDDQLAYLWKTLMEQPSNEQSRRSFIRYLHEQATCENQKQLLNQVHSQLANTPSEQRQFVFFPLLSQLADQLVEDGRIELAHNLYQLLQQQGAGDFQQQLERLRQYQEVQECIQMARSVETDVRWELWQDAWLQ
jgi:hypothetical protein